MAKNTKPSKKDFPIKDRTIFWTDLSYTPPELKNETWAAQCIYFMKKNGRLFLDPTRAWLYRATDLLQIDKNEMQRMFDPVTPEGTGGQAEFVSADWKAYPIYIHLLNNIRAEVQRTSKQIEVNFTDKYSKTRKMRDNYKILYQKQIRAIINEFAEELKIPGITESQDPYKWIQQFSKDQQKKEKPEPGQQEGGGDMITKFADLIKNKIENNEDLILYNEFVYKGDYEQAMERAIQYYMFQLNKWEDRWSDEFFDDIRHFNKSAGEWYTDRITGRPVIEHFVPELLYTSPFKRKDGEDVQYYFTEYLISFRDFVRTIGYGLKEEKLKAVFDYNKTQGTVHGLDWVENVNRANTTRDGAMIKVGRAAVLSQDCDIFLDDVASTYNQYQKADINWDRRLENEYVNVDQKHYNVWRTFYYLPPNTADFSNPSNADYSWQAQFIFDIKKNQDQFRYGEEDRYAKSPLILYDNSRQASTTDIVQAYMPKINFAWNSYQNCLVNDVDATILSDELMGGLLSAVDEDNSDNPGMRNEPVGGNEVDAARQQFRMIKQAGKGFLKMVDKQGKPILDPSKMILVYKNGYLERADKFLGQCVNLYSQLITALGNEPEGDKARVPVAGIEEAMKTSANSKWFMQKGYEEIIKQYGERMVRYVLTIGKESKEYGAPQRYDDFKDILGLSSGLLIEGLEDVPPESIGLTVSYIDNTARKDYIMQLADRFSQQGKLDDDILYLLMGTDNWKYAWCLIRMGLTKKKKEMAAQQALAHQEAMEEKEMDLKIAETLAMTKGAAKDKNIQTQAQGKAMTDKLQNENKARTIADQKDHLLNNKLKEQEQKHQLEREDKTYDALAPAGS